MAEQNNAKLNSILNNDSNKYIIDYNIKVNKKMDTVFLVASKLLAVSAFSYILIIGLFILYFLLFIF